MCATCARIGCFILKYLCWSSSRWLCWWWWAVFVGNAVYGASAVMMTMMRTTIKQRVSNYKMQKSWPYTKHLVWLYRQKYVGSFNFFRVVVISGLIKYQTICNKISCCRFQDILTDFFTYLGLYEVLARKLENDTKTGFLCKWIYNSHDF